MILAIDIGNSNIVIGILEKQRVLVEERLSTNHSQTEVEYAIAIKNILDISRIDPSRLEGGILSSVVPPISSTVKKAAEKILGKTILQVGPGLKTGLNLKVDNPAALGSDRVVDAVAAIYHYPAPLIIFDMGTATTISAIDHEGSYLGGVIIPGVKVSLDSLTQNTSQLPKISLEAPKATICRRQYEKRSHFRKRFSDRRYDRSDIRRIGRGCHSGCHRGPFPFYHPPLQA